MRLNFFLCPVFITTFFFNLYFQERRKEKRRLQDQLRRIRRNELKAKLHGVPIGQPISKVTLIQLSFLLGHLFSRKIKSLFRNDFFEARVTEKKPPVIKPNLLKMRCSACHGTGHMKTNKNCPLYGKDPTKTIKTVGDIHPVFLNCYKLSSILITQFCFE